MVPCILRSRIQVFTYCACALVSAKGLHFSGLHYRGITLLSVVGKVFFLMIGWYNIWMKVKLALQKRGCCIDNVYTLNEIVQGRLKEGKKTCFSPRCPESL